MALSHQKASTSAPLRKYHVFLSFRGEDVRKGFLSDLDDKLQARAIATFKDDRELKKGKIIGKALELAIEQSRFSIVVVSKNYAESDWCLSELAHIVQCMQESDRIMPIFYGVEPRDVRHQTGSFAQHFTKHEKEHGKQVVREWKDALTKLGNHSGWDSTNCGNETELIKKIADEVWEKVYTPFRRLGSTQKLDRLDGKLKKIETLLNLEANDVRFIGIWGTDEIGIKTTSKLVYSGNSDMFEVHSFLKEIRKDSKCKGLVYLQAQLLGDLNRRYTPVSDVYEGKNMTKRCIGNKKVLSILNDVDQSDQLEILGGEKVWYGKGSRIIITSMKRDLLVKHGIEEPYLVEGLTKDDALQLNS